MRQRFVALIAACALIAAVFAVHAVWTAISHHELSALLINNDPSERHLENMIAARRACEHMGFNRIVAFGGAEKPVSARSIRDELKNSDVFDLVYVTGHGSLLYESGKPMQSSLMFLDGPLRGIELAQAMKSNSAALYVDVCFAPGWGDELSRARRGPLLFLSDKNPNDETRSCRGVSVMFWQEASRLYEGDLWMAMKLAWQKSSPDGVCIDIE